MLSFFNRIRQTASNIGHKANRHFNKIKEHTRSAIPWIKQISSAVYHGAKNYGVGTVASQIGAVAGAVNKGAHIVEKGLNSAEGLQRDWGWSI